MCELALYTKYMKFSPKSSDQVLINGCREGNRLAQKFLYERFFGRMMGIAMRYTSHRDEATDILNAAFLKVFTGLDKFEDGTNLAGWVAKIVFNTSIDFVRRHAKYKQVFDLSVERDQSVYNASIDNLNTQDLFKLIQLLPISSRTVFNLYVVDGYKHKEVADILSITEGTSKWHLANARKELQRLILKRRAEEAAAGRS